MLPPVQSDDLRQFKYSNALNSDVLRIDSFYFLLFDRVKGCLRVVGPGYPRRQKQRTLAIVLWNRDDHGTASPDIRPPSVGADGTDSRFALDKTVEWKVIV